MAVHLVIWVCLATLLATPVLGAEGNPTSTIKLAKYLEQELPLLERHEALLPQVKVSEKYDYYDVDGATPDELRSQMKRNGTTWNDGKVYAALTSWDIRYHYDITTSNGRFSLNSIVTDVDIVFHLPRLVPTAKTSQGLTASWNSYLANLRTHENGHRDIAVDIGREIYQVLSTMGSRASRSELEENAKTLLKAKFQRLKQDQIAYDQETHHGKKQGAVLMDPMLASVPAGLSGEMK